MSDQSLLIRTFSNRDGDLAYSVSDGKAKSLFKISASKFPPFFKEYCSLVEDNKDLSLSEMIPQDQEIIPLIGNFHFRFDDDHRDGEIYNDSFPLALVNCYRQTISDIFESTETLSEYYCFFMEAEPYFGDDHQTFVNIRVQFPWCRMKNNFYHMKFRPQLILNLLREKVSDYFIPILLSNWEESLEDFKCLSKNGFIDRIPLYGSKYSSLFEPVSLRYIFESELENIENADLSKYMNIDFSDISPKSHSVIAKRLTNSNIISELERGPAFWLPVILSYNYCDTIMVPVSEVDVSSEETRILDMEDIIDSDSAQDLLELFLNLLSSERFKDVSCWQEIGKIIYVTTGGKKFKFFEGKKDKIPEGLEMWIRYSEKYGYNRTDCINLWNDFNPAKIPITIKRLAEYIREDEPDIFETWHKEWCRFSFNRAVELSSDDNLAEAFYRLFWLKFLFYSNSTKGSWYKFTGIRLIQITSHQIHKSIRTKYANVYKDMMSEISNSLKSGKLTEVEERANLEKLKKITDVVKKIQNSSAKRKIIESATTFFENTSFSKFKNADPRLMGTENCILQIIEDGKNKYIRPRTGYIEDYVTMSTRVSYQYFTEKDSKIIRVREILKQLMCYDKEMEIRLRRKLASLMIGINLEKYFTVATGDGDNGKSIFFNLIKCALGEYYCEMATEMITTKPKSSSQARPELMATLGTRIAVVSEHDSTPIQSVNVKQMSGGADKMKSRDLFQGMEEITIMYKPFLQTNFPPEFTDTGRAVKARIDLLPFIATFVDDAPNSLEEQIKTRRFPKVLELEEEVGNLGSAMLWCMVNDFPDYTRHNLKTNIPSFIIDNSRSYWEEKDMYTAFINDTLNLDPIDPISKLRRGKDNVTIQEIYKVFQIWFHAEKPGRRVPDSSQVATDLKDPYRLGPYAISKERKWSGIRIKESYLEKMREE